MGALQGFLGAIASDRSTFNFDVDVYGTSNEVGLSGGAALVKREQERGKIETHNRMQIRNIGTPIDTDIIDVEMYTPNRC